MHVVGAAFYSLWQLTILKTPNEGAIAVCSIIDIEKVIIWFYTETKKKTLKRMGILDGVYLT